MTIGKLNLIVLTSSKGLSWVSKGSYRFKLGLLCESRIQMLWDVSETVFSTDCNCKFGYIVVNRKPWNYV